MMLMNKMWALEVKYLTQDQRLAELAPVASVTVQCAVDRSQLDTALFFNAFKKLECSVTNRKGISIFKNNSSSLAAYLKNDLSKYKHLSTIK